MATPLTTQGSFTVSANITKGCVLGSNGIDTSNYGTINFGSAITQLNSHIDIISQVNNGSIILQCTPNTQGNIGLSSGLYISGSIVNGRKIQNPSSGDTLDYQLYQDINYSILWGDNSNDGNRLSFTADGSVQIYPVYARLFAQSLLPHSGNYTDTVTVTISY